MDYARLWSLIEGPPFSELDAAACAAALNAKTASRLRQLSSAELLAWAGQEGRLARIKAAAASESDELASVAEVALKMVSRDTTVLDLNLPDRLAMLDVLVTAGVFTASDKTSLQAAAGEQVSAAEQAGLGKVYPGHIQKARAHHGVG